MKPLWNTTERWADGQVWTGSQRPRDRRRIEIGPTDNFERAIKEFSSANGPSLREARRKQYFTGPAESRRRKAIASFNRERRAAGKNRRKEGAARRKQRHEATTE